MQDIIVQREPVLISSLTEGIEEFTETGIKSKTGQEIDIDLAILATGFKIEESICGFEIIGKNGVNLRQQFDDFPVAFNGITVPNFPNFFILLGPNTVLAHSSVLFMIECQADYILNCVKVKKCRYVIKKGRILGF